MTDTPGRRSKVLTLVFTDLANSTALKTERGDAAIEALIARHAEHVTRLAVACGGRIIDWAGDGCFLSFDTSSSALIFALRLQLTHADEPDLPGVRTGIHMGEVTETIGDGGAPRVAGLAVDVASRICGLAHPGQVLMSGAVHDSARQRIGIETLGRPILWRSHGSYALKGFDKAIDICEAGIEHVAPLTRPAAGDKARLVRRATPARQRPDALRPGTGWRAGAVGVAATLVLASVAYVASHSRRAAIAPEGSAGSPTIRSLAVLPLENLSEKPDQEYFADGMTEALITELAKIKGIKIISRTSVMHYKGVRTKTSPEIGRELGVDSLIEGSVLEDGNQVRITAQLIRAATDEHVWAESYTNAIENVLQLQSKVALEIAGRIDAIVTPEEKNRIGSAKSVRPEAYGHYLEGLYFWNQRTARSLDQARHLFADAIESDPGFALAHVGLADALLVQTDFEATAEIAGSISKAREEVEKALEMDPHLGEAYTALGALYDGFDWRWADADEAYRKSIELSPGYATAHQWHAELLTNLGRTNDALVAIRRAYELDPFSPVIGITLAQNLASAGFPQQAIDQVEKMRLMHPGNSRVARLATITYCQLGRFDEALRLNDERNDEFKNDRTLVRAGLLARFGRSDEARGLLERAIEENGETDARPVLYAGTYALLDDRDEAFEWLERGFRMPVSGVWSIKSDSNLRSLHDDPRYKDLLRRMNLPE